MPKLTKYFVSEDGSSLFEDWLVSLDNIPRAIVIRTIRKVADGGAKKSIKALKDGVFEIKIPHGPGLRVYFAEVRGEIILLLVGGIKRNQSKDIKRAKKMWRNYGK